MTGVGVVCLFWALILVVGCFGCWLLLGCLLFVAAARGPLCVFLVFRRNEDSVSWTNPLHVMMQWQLVQHFGPTAPFSTYNVHLTKATNR